MNDESDAAFLSSGSSRRRLLLSITLLALVGLSTFFGLDYRGNYPNISYAHFAAYFENPLKGYLAFRKNVLTSYLFDWKEGIRPVRSGSSVGFDLLDPSHPSAVAFRKQNKLDALVASTTSNFNKAIRIRQWTHEKVWPLTLSKIPYSLTREGKGGFTLLRGIQRNERMMCGEAATLFVQAAGVVGIPAREVIGYRHITAEAWSSDHRKWVLMDPLYNAHYERGGIPLSFLELTQAFYSKTGRKPEAYHHELDQVIHQSTGTSEDVFRKALGTIENFYRRVGIEPKGGPRSLPARIPSDRIKDVISGGAIGDMSHSAFAAFGVALRSDYLVYQYPIWHLRHYNHMWNYLYWTGSSPKRPNQAYQFTAKREDFNFTPRLPRQENR